MLGGGYYRGASVLVTGFPGTAKTTLSGTFAEAACPRGERMRSGDHAATAHGCRTATVRVKCSRHAPSGVSLR